MSFDIGSTPGQSPLTMRGKVTRRFTDLISEMEESWTPHWQDIMEHISPRRGMWRGKQPNKGDKQNDQIRDSTATFAHRVVQAGMQAGLTSPNHQWFELTTGDPAEDKFGPVKNWLTLVQREMYDIFQTSNLYRVFPTLYGELADVGTTAVHIDESPESVVHGQQDTIGTYALAQGPDGKIDTIARKRWRTVANLVQEFGLENVSRKTREAYENNKMNGPVRMHQLIEPNLQKVPGAADFRGMEFISYKWEEGSGEDEWLSVRGYRSFPVMCPRWETTSDNVYGTDCPGMTCLPDVKQLQFMIERKSEAVEKMVRPPLAVPSSMRTDTIDLRPAGLNYYDALGGGSSIQPILKFVPPLNEMRLDILELRNSINRAYFADLFITILQHQGQSPQKTATEIAAIQGEKLLMLGPTIERVFDDMLRPLVHRTFEKMVQFGRVPPPPPELRETGFTVDFVSTLALAQKTAGMVSVERGMGFVGNLAAVFPDAIDVVDVDGAVEHYLHLLRVPPEMVRPREERDAIRAQRAQLAQAAASAPIAKEGAEAARLLSETPVGNETLLDRVIGGAAGGAPR
jgi:hypothetical protein